MPPDPRPSATDVDLAAAVVAGDASALDTLVDAHHASLVRFLSGIERDPAARDELVQGTWVAALEAISRFAGRSSFRTWLFSIALNEARSAARTAGRMVPLSSLGAEVDDEPEVDRFLPDGHWARPVRPWESSPERQVELSELRALVDTALTTLPPAQRTVVVLRDVDGLDSREVCAVMGITEANQRVLLHRGRTRIREALEAQLGKGGAR